MCEHEIAVKIENGILITYCKKCGAILDTKNVDQNVTCQETPGIIQNGGVILHG